MLTLSLSRPSGLQDFYEELGNRDQTFPCRPEEDSGKQSQGSLQGGRTAAVGIRGVRGIPQPISLNLGSHSALSVGLSLSLCALFCSAVTVTQPESISPPPDNGISESVYALTTFTGSRGGQVQEVGSSRTRDRLADQSGPHPQAGSLRQEVLWPAYRSGPR